MIRRLDGNGDWVFGSGKGAYIDELEGLVLRLQTQLREWTGDCFFAPERGINWHLMDKREQRVMNEIRAAIMQNSEVLSIDRIEINKTADREWKPDIYLTTMYGEARL
jgi:hypothetical protein